MTASEPRYDAACEFAEIEAAYAAVDWAQLWADLSEDVLARAEARYANNPTALMVVREMRRAMTEMVDAEMARIREERRCGIVHYTARGRAYTSLTPDALARAGERRGGGE